jgi:phage terminase large subunit-like protein
MLSNTATPKYYGLFRDNVLSGEIPVNETVSMQMNLIDDLIRNPNIYYDDKAVEGFVKFCENELVLTDGSDLKLLDTFKLWAEDILGWYYFIDRSVPIVKNGEVIRYENRKVKKRLRNKQYLIVARGAAKTIYCSCLHQYFLTINSSTTQQIATAPTMSLSEETLFPIRTALSRSRGPLYKLLTMGSTHNTNGSKADRPKLLSTKQGIENQLTNSILKVLPMTIDKLQGRRPFFTSIDEWLSGDVKEDVMSAVEQGAAKVDDWLIVAISSEGTVRNGPGDTIKMELMKILKGEYVNPHTSVWWYKLDDVKEVADPSMWAKAQPNIGKTVSYETYQTEVERAENSPSARNDILAKRFGLPMEGYTYFFTYEETLKTSSGEEFWNMPCSLGADLSQGNDFCAFSFLFPLGNDIFGVKVLSFITERTLNNLPLAMRIKYDDFLKEGSLLVHNGTILDMMAVYDDLEKHIEQMRYDVRTFGYDPYNARTFVERWETENGPFGIEKVPQGSKTESVPLGELKTLIEDRCIKFDQDLMSFCMGNCIVIIDTNGNRKLLKNAYENKIDNFAATMDAYIAYKANVEAFE